MMQVVPGSQKRFIRELTAIEKKCVAKYRGQLVKAEAEVARLRELLGDLAVTFSGREEPVTMTDTHLLEPESK